MELMQFTERTFSAIRDLVRAVEMLDERDKTGKGGPSPKLIALPNRSRTVVDARRIEAVYADGVDTVVVLSGEPYIAGPKEQYDEVVGIWRKAVSE